MACISVPYLNPSHPAYVPPSPNWNGSVLSPPMADPVDHVASSSHSAKAIGTTKILVIMIDFPDKAGTKTTSYFNDLLFGGHSGSLDHHYTEVSYGLLTLNGSFAPGGWYRSAHNLVWWGADSATEKDHANGYIYNLAREVLTLANADVDYSKYDTDHNGVIEDSEVSLCIIHAGDGEESSDISSDIWSHQWDIGSDALILDGVNWAGHSYTMQAETSPMGTFAHEFGHDLGLPDLYDTTENSSGIGNWCLMSGGSWNGDPQGSSPAHPSAWCKIKLGWITPTIVAPTASIPGATVPQVETSPTVYKLSYSTNEYFLIENREKTGYDSALPGEGILIWHVDESVMNNDDPTHKMVDLEEAHGGIQDLDLKNHNEDANDPYSSNVNGFTGTTDPNSRAYDGRDTGVMVTHISAAGSTMTVNFGLVETTPPTISSQTPSSGSIIANSRPTISASYSDVSGINQPSVVIKVDSVTVTSIASVNASGFSYTSSSTLPDGLHTVYLSVADNAGNIATSTWMFTIDTTPPTISSQSPANGTVLNTSTPTISTSYSDSSKVDPSSVVIEVDSVNVTSSASVTSSGLSYTPVSSLSEGNHTVFLSVKDTVGNTATSAWSFTVDTIPPTIYSQSPPFGFIIGTPTPTISAAFADNIGVNPSSVVIMVDGITVTVGAYVTASGFYYIPSSISDGSHTVYVSVKDTAGNTATAGWSFIVDTVPPTIYLSTPVNESTFYALGGAQVAINASYSDNMAINLASIALKVDGNDVTGESTVTATGISYLANVKAGDHIIQLFVSDKAGNVVTSTLTFTIVDYTVYIILAAIIVVAIVAVMFFKRKKRPMLRPTVSSQPPSTTSPPLLPPMAAPSPPPAQPPSKAYCFYCGAENSTEAIYCQKCGKEIRQPPTEFSTST